MGKLKELSECLDDLLKVVKNKEVKILDDKKDKVEKDVEVDKDKDIKE
jgi:hypothetical protein